MGIDVYKRQIVESPAKAKTIGQYLGDDYEVTASMGHIRDLPASQLGIDVEHGYAPQLSLIHICIADLVLVFPDHLELLDYKTDRRKTEADFLSAYRPQLNLYAPVSYTHLLAERILSAEGGAAVQTLSDAGRAVLVRRALEELQDQIGREHV